jgi:hypothetical protein
MNATNDTQTQKVTNKIINENPRDHSNQKNIKDIPEGYKRQLIAEMKEDCMKLQEKFMLKMSLRNKKYFMAKRIKTKEDE